MTKVAERVAAARVSLSGAETAIMERYADRDAALADAARLTADLDAAVVDDPERAATLMVELRAVQDRADVAGLAVPKLEAARTDAARAVLSAETDALRPAVDRVRRQIKQHETRTTELLSALQEHTGVAWEARDAFADFAAFGAEGVTSPPQTVAVLRARLAEAERPLIAIESVLSDESPRIRLPDLSLHELPACIHPVTGIMPAAGFDRDVVHAVIRDHPEAFAAADRVGIPTELLAAALSDDRGALTEVADLAGRIVEKAREAHEAVEAYATEATTALQVEWRQRAAQADWDAAHAATVLGAINVTA